MHGDQALLGVRHIDSVGFKSKMYLLSWRWHLGKVSSYCIICEWQHNLESDHVHCNEARLSKTLCSGWEGEGDFQAEHLVLQPCSRLSRR